MRFDIFPAALHLLHASFAVLGINGLEGVTYMLVNSLSSSPVTSQLWFALQSIGYTENESIA
jgi:hypothetical protein